MSSGRDHEDVAFDDALFAKLEHAAQWGSWNAVATVLSSRPDADLDARPEAWLLLSRCRFDQADYGRSLAAIDRAEKHGVAEAECETWRLRVCAAAGNAAAANRSLDRLASQAAPGAVAALSWIAGLSLGRFGPLAPAAATLKTSSDEQWGGLIQRLQSYARNLQWLQTFDPPRAASLAKFRPWDRFQQSQVDQTIVPFLRAGGEPQPLFVPERQSAVENNVWEAYQKAWNPRDPVLVVGAGAGLAVDALLQTPEALGKRVGVVLIEPNDPALAWLLWSRDLAAAIDEGRLHLPPGDRGGFTKYLEHDLRRVPRTYRYPTFDLTGDGTGGKIVGEVNVVLDRIRNEADAYTDRVASYYSSDEFADRWRAQSQAVRDSGTTSPFPFGRRTGHDSESETDSDNLSEARRFHLRDDEAQRERRPPGSPLRILIQTCQYTTFIHANSLQFADCLRRAGYETEVLQEGDEPHHWVGAAAIQEKVAAFLPDLYIRFNFLRQETEAYLPTEMPFLTIVQDECPFHYDASRPSQLLPRDYMTGLTKGWLEYYGYPGARYLVSNVPSDRSLYFAPARGDRRYEHDFSYISHQSLPADAWLQRQLNACGAEERHVLCDVLERFQTAGADGEFVTDAVRRWGTAFYENRLGAKPNQNFRLKLSQLTNLYFRQLILTWISQAGYDLALYGAGWSEHPELARHARGIVASGAELKATYRRTRINLQLVASGNFHQRLVDGYLAGGFFLMPRIVEDRRLASANPEQERKLVWRLMTEPISTADDMRRLAPEETRLLETIADRDSAPDPDAALLKAFRAMEVDAITCSSLRLLDYESVLFDDRKQLCQQAERWLRDDEGREAYVDRLRQSGVLEPTTSEAFQRRLIRWLADRIVRISEI